MRPSKTAIVLLLAVLAITQPAQAGLLSGLIIYGGCQTACNAMWVSCYGAAGLVAGTLTAGVGIPEAAIGCNTLQGICMAACAGGTTAALVAPAP